MRFSPGDVEVRLKELLLEKAEELDMEIENMEVMPDHVHIFVKAKPVDSPHYILQQLKGYSSQETVKRYIDDQKNT